MYESEPMFGCYSELVACTRDCEDNIESETPNLSDDQHNALSPLSAFGGFKTWPPEGRDFLLLAECSEINGPIPLFAFPSQRLINVDLNSLCLHILSADYQGLSCDSSIPTGCTQLLMPDVMDDVHVAVNHFIVFDTKARGFVRPLCLAYITSDKFKLIELADKILKNLSFASSFIRCGNKIFVTKEFEKLLADLEWKRKEISDSKDSVLDSPLQDKSLNCTIESYIEDVERTIEYVQQVEDLQGLDCKKICFLQKLKEHVSAQIFGMIEESFNNLSHEASIGFINAQEFQFPLQQHFGKILRPLMTICSGGIVLAIYHLFIVYKFFQRNYENIFLKMEEEIPNKASHDSYSLHFGACIKLTGSSRNISKNHCHFVVPNIPSTFDADNIDYLSCLDSEFGTVVEECIHGLNLTESSVSDGSNKLSLLSLEDTGCSTFSPKQKCDVHESAIYSNFYQDSDSHACKSTDSCLRHVFTLGDIWDTLDLLEERNAHSVFSDILEIFQQSESLFFSLLTRSMIVVVSTQKDMQFVELFIETLAAFVPRAKRDSVWVEPYRKVPLEKQDLANLTAVGFCLSTENSVADFVPADLMPFISVLNLRDKSFSGPKYSGCLLSGIDGRLKAALEAAYIFPVLISMLAEVELKVKLWLSIVSSSMNTTMATHHLIQKGFSSCDMQILQKLSKFCMLS